MPYLRGYGTTRFLSDETVRNGQQSALAVDAIALMDALDIDERDRGRLRLGRAHRATSSPRCGPSAARASCR